MVVSEVFINIINKFRKMSEIMDFKTHLKTVLGTTLKTYIPLKLIPILIAKQINKGGFVKFILSLTRTIVFNCKSIFQ